MELCLGTVQHYTKGEIYNNEFNFSSFDFRKAMHVYDRLSRDQQRDSFDISAW